MFSDTDANRMLPQGRALVENNGPTLAWIAGPKAAFTDKSHSFRAGTTVEKSVALLNDTRDPQPYTLTWTVSAAGGTVATKTVSGKLAPSETAFVPITFAATGATTRKTSGKITLAATIGGREHRDSFDFRVFPKQPATPTGGRNATVTNVYAFDPAGETTALLKSLGYAVRPWAGNIPGNATVIIGRKALSSVPLDEANRRLAALRAHVAKGGRALLMAQDPDWMRTYSGLRVSGIMTRRTFPVIPAHPALAGLDATDLRDWTGESRLVVARPDYLKTEHLKAPSGSPYWGWRWGARHAVSSAAVEKPHRAGWRPLLECEFDLAYSPLMTLDHGKGTLTLCTLDLEDHVSADPAAAKLATQMLRAVTTAPSAPRKASTLLIGATDSDRKLLDGVGLRYKESAKLPAPGADALVLVGSGVVPGAAPLEGFARAGGTVLVLPRFATSADPLGARREVREGSLGATTTPQWQEARGLSVSDLRWRNEASATVLVGGNGIEIGADGFLGRRKVGKGVILFCQIDPNALDVDARTYHRLSRWRQTRAFTQVAANLGASFDQDERIFSATSARADLVPLGGAWKIQVTQKLPASPEPDKPSADPGISPAASALLGQTTDESGMRNLNLPGSVAEFTDNDGEAVARRVVEIPAAWAGKDLELSLGAVDDTDETYWNGAKVGGSKGWNVARTYVIPGAQVKAGRNVIAVRVFDNYGGGGFSGTADQLSLRPASKTAARANGLYHPDYRADFDLGDDPYRYYRW
jgi:beta-galactosidase